MSSRIEAVGILRFRGMSKSEAEAALKEAASKGSWTSERYRLQVTVTDYDYMIRDLGTARRAS